MRRRALLLVLLLPLCGVPASGYVYDTWNGKPVRWPDGWCKMYIDKDSVPGEKVQDLLWGMQTWSHLDGSSWRFVWGGYSPSSDVRDTTNGNCDISYLSDPMSLPVDLWAYVSIVYPLESDVIVDRDVIVNSDFRIRFPELTPPVIDYKNMVLHELGHVLGLMHEVSWNDAVMNAMTFWTEVIREPYADDQAGVRFLYPEHGAPGPPPNGPDPAVDVVAFGPRDAGPGDEIEIDYMLRNRGLRNTTGFTIGFSLGGGPGPTEGDLDLGMRVEAMLRAGDKRVEALTVTLPVDMLPGAYRPWVVVDPGGAIQDEVRTNNAGTSPYSIRVERDPMPLPPSCRVTAELGPTGRDVFELTAPAGARVKVKAKASLGALSLALRAPDGPDEASSDTRRKPGLKATLQQTGTYRLLLDSTHPANTAYSLKVRLKAYEVEGETPVDGEVRIPVPVHEGSVVKVRVRSIDDLLPEVSIAGIDTDVKKRKGGRKVKLAAFVAPRNETIEVVLRRGAGPAGTARYVVDVKPASTRVEMTR